jgi:hypothetical protein
VCCRTRCLGAAALIDRDVGEDCALLHSRDHLARDQLRGQCARDQDRTDDDIGLLHGLLDLQARRHDEADAARQDFLEVPHAVERALEDRDVRSEADRDHGRVVADHSAADDQHASGRDPGHAAEQQPTAAERLLEEVRAGLRRKPACDLAHRCEQRQCAGIRLHRLVRDGRDATLEEGARQRLVGGDVKVGEEDEALAEPAVLRLDRLLHLEEQVRF